MTPAIHRTMISTYTHLKEETACVTGHRPENLGGYDPNPLQDWVRGELAKVLRQLRLAGSRYFICGGAQGTDWIAAEEVISLRRCYSDVRLILALPFVRYTNRWPEALTRKFQETILAQADEWLYVSEGPGARWKYQVRNVWMVDRSARVVAVWDQSSGGTANTYKYARLLKRPISQINPATRNTVLRISNGLQVLDLPQA